MWMDKKSEDMTLDEAREAVKTLRKIVALRITEPISNITDDMELTGKDTIDKIREDEWKPTFKKPPLGCKPACVASVERMKELTDAISRQLNDVANEQLISRWATEILYQCKIMTDC